MLDAFFIVSKGGLILFTWLAKHNMQVKGKPLDEFATGVLMGTRLDTKHREAQRATTAITVSTFTTGISASSTNSDGYTAKYSIDNVRDLVFIALYPRGLQLKYVERLVLSVRNSFIKAIGASNWWNEYDGQGCVWFLNKFQTILAKCEDVDRDSVNGKRVLPVPNEARQNGNSIGTKHQAKAFDENENDVVKNGDPEIAVKENNVIESNESLENDVEKSTEVDFEFDTAKLDKLRRRGRQHDEGRRKKDTKKSTTSSTDSPKRKAKSRTTWDLYGRQEGPEDEAELDYSVASEDTLTNETKRPSDLDQLGHARMDEEEDYDDEDDDSFDNGTSNVPSNAKSKGGWFNTMMISIVGKNELEVADLDPIMEQLRQRLITKNVAEEIASKLTASVSAALVGRKLDSFTSIRALSRKALEDALVRILTPHGSTDVLGAVKSSKGRGRPYVIVFIGVNGVGKSTNLSKVAYWLLDHQVKVGIAACDTFRAGAVEQLRTHVQRLNASFPGVKLYEKGYEKDPAGVAADAINQARKDGFDVVLVDTAGRMQDNEPLMRALAKLVYINNPDLTLFVGEALVGNDAVDQLSKFNQKLIDLSPGSNVRTIDGILLTKFDTIDDKVGAALSMTYTSGAPILFVGSGQTYVDLRKLNVKSIVKSLLS